MADYIDTAEFIQDLITRQHAAWLALYERYYSTIFSYSYKVIQDDFYARNIATDTFLKLYKDPARFKPTDTVDNVLAYLYVVARNACFNHIKTNQRRLQRETAYSKISEDSQKVDLMEDMELIQTEGQIMQEVYTVYQNMPQHYKDTIQLIYGEGYTYRQAAETLGVSVHSLKGYKAAAVDKLRQVVLNQRVTTSLSLLLFYCSIHNN